MPRTSTSIWCVQACGLRGRTSIAAMACKYIRCQSGRIPVHRLGPDMGAMERSLWARSCWIDGAPTCQREHRRRVDAAGSVNTRSSHPTAHCGNRRVYNRWQHHSDLCQSLDDDRTRDRIELDGVIFRRHGQASVPRGHRRTVGNRPGSQHTINFTVSRKRGARCGTWGLSHSLEAVG